MSTSNRRLQQRKECEALWSGRSVVAARFEPVTSRPEPAEPEPAPAPPLAATLLDGSQWSDALDHMLEEANDGRVSTDDAPPVSVEPPNDRRRRAARSSAQLHATRHHDELDEVMRVLHSMDVADIAAPAAPPSQSVLSPGRGSEVLLQYPPLLDASGGGRRVLLHDMIASASPSHPIHAARRDLAYVLDSALHVDSPPLPRVPSLSSLRPALAAPLSSSGSSPFASTSRSGLPRSSEGVAPFSPGRRHFAASAAAPAPLGPVVADAVLRSRPWSLTHEY